MAVCRRTRPRLLQQYGFIAAFTTRTRLRHPNPYFIGRLDGEEIAQDEKTMPETNPVRFGIVGCGSASVPVCEAMTSSTLTELTAVYDVNEGFGK